MKRIICFLLASALMVTVPVANATAELEEAEYREEYEASSIWLSETEGTVHLSDPEGLLLEMELDMRIPADTVLETEAESLAVMDMDRWRLAIMDESSRAGFTQTEYGSRISISLLRPNCISPTPIRGMVTITMPTYGTRTLRPIPMAKSKV